MESIYDEALLKKTAKGHIKLALEDLSTMDFHKSKEPKDIICCLEGMLKQQKVMELVKKQDDNSCESSLELETSVGYPENWMFLNIYTTDQGNQVNIVKQRSNFTGSREIIDEIVSYKKRDLYISTLEFEETVCEMVESLLTVLPINY